MLTAAEPLSSYLDVSAHPTTRVARAARIQNDTLQTWLKRPDLYLSADQRFQTDHSRYFSARQTLTVAVTAELWRVGIPLRDATRIASSITAPWLTIDLRLGLFLRVAGPQSAEVVTRGCVGDPTQGHWSAVFINLTRLIRHTCAVLGLPTSEASEAGTEAYAEIKNMMEQTDGIS